MHFSGAGLGEMGHGAVPAHGNCNPRKFSEKIALHNQRQAEETAAFREVMMDITSIRVQAKRVRQTRDLLPYYGGSLPNVNQISRCSTETQYPSYLTQQLLEADEEYRDVQPSPLSRPHRRPFESAPYLSTHLSPPRAPVWRRNWSTCSATEKSQMVTLPLTALNRTNSDSALHTSVRNTQFHGHQRSSQSRHRGFVHPAPLIEENIQEETRSPKLKRFSSVGSSGCETPAVHFPLSDQQQTSSLPIPSSLSVSGSLPDLSSLHLPSPLPSAPELEPQTRADPLSTANTEPGIVTDFSLPALSSSLQPSLSIPLLQSSVSNPNIQSCLSTHSLPASLSSTSLRLSLSNSSLQSSLSNHSLQSSLSSSSLSSQSLHSSGFGGSGSSTSSSGSPRVTSGSFGSSFSGSPRVNLGSSRKRAQISPLIVPSGDTRWQHPKQFSPTASPTLSSVSQGAFLNSSKAPKDTKPPAYPCPPQLRSPHLSHQPLRHYFHPEGQHQSIPEIPEQWIQHDAQQQTHVQRQQLFHKHCQQLQHQTQQPSQAFPQIQPLYPEQISEEQHHWRLSSMKNTQSLHGFTSSVQEDQWGHRRASPEQQQTQGKRRYCLQEEAEEATPAESQAEAAALQQQCNESIPGSQEKDFVLNKDSYVGLHLTPSQAKALSQQLGTLQKDPAGGSRESELKRETVESSSADPEPPPQSLSCGGGETHSLFNINLTDTSCWLDQDFSGLPDSVLEFDLESFGLDSNLGWP